MRWGILSDIHANLPALEAALGALERESVDGYLCPGDLVGYGPHPNEVVALVRSLDPICVHGNHDLIALGRLPEESADGLARGTLAWTRDRLDAPARDYLAQLPALARAHDAAVAHGSPSDPTRYVLGPDSARAALAELRDPAARLLVLGHTHVPLAIGERSGRLTRRAIARPAAGERWVVNPGSVGQPRELRRVVRFAVLDAERSEVEFHAIRYDHRRTARDLLAAGLPPRALHRRPRLRSKLKRARIMRYGSSPRSSILT